jgi:ribose 5-phosphate isomerase B
MGWKKVAGGNMDATIDRRNPPQFLPPLLFHPLMKKFTIAIGSDHAGFAFKEAIKALLLAEGHTVRDLGTYHETPPSDYPDFIRPVAEAVARGEFERGIVLGGSGNGEAIVANRVRGVRCGLCWNEQIAIWNRAHNDANCLSIGQRTIPLDEALKIVKTWLATEFEGGRHIARLKKIDP